MVAAASGANRPWWNFTVFSLIWAISAGVADMRYPDKDTAEELLKRVTEALTRAKKARNSVELYQPPVEIALG